MIRPLFTRRQVQILSSVFVISLCLYIYYFLATSDARRWAARTSKLEPTADTRPPRTPTDYAAPTSESIWCQERFGLRFLENMRNFTGSYCSHEAESSLDCFWSETAKGRLDTTCFARRAVFDPERKSFHIDCPLRAAEDNAHGLPRIPQDMHAYWYDTGPLQILNKSLLLDGGAAAAARPRAERTTILVKREGTNNMWHSLMEIMSLSWSLDTLQMSSTETGAAYLSPSQRNSTQIVLVDDFDLGPYIELWRLFAQMPIRRLSELDAEEPPSDIVVPLVGGSNPLWQGDWVELSCTEASLVSTFVRRVLDLYKITDDPPASTGGSDTDIVVTFVARKGARELLDQDAHMEALRAAVPHMKLSVVDFASMPLHQQVQVARHTDVLLGVHGAGLTHSMFMRPGAVLVEVLPADFAHKGFRNLAQMLGHRYFRTHAKPAAPRRRRDWQQDPVEIDQQRLIDVVRAGVQAMYSRGGRSYDVS
ncbi:DUF563 domain-containing protein [Cordyceps javanica]|uniref:EGF domain-specific O-linked N-acetylglucosamine transferase n=1 Tax=Cordyceps javanica TaxID=43265 RepID=A0A545VZP3_9HYPO|nr:DUF563 domain-containing protein [Cordyceps javanica]TQW07183.1 DUF563 domain protein [Cordyceps javanica]